MLQGKASQTRSAQRHRYHSLFKKQMRTPKLPWNVLLRKYKIGPRKGLSTHTPGDSKTNTAWLTNGGHFVSKANTGEKGLPPPSHPILSHALFQAAGGEGSPGRGWSWAIQSLVMPASHLFLSNAGGRSSLLGQGQKSSSLLLL